MDNLEKKLLKELKRFNQIDYNSKNLEEQNLAGFGNLGMGSHVERILEETEGWGCCCEWSENGITGELYCSAWGCRCNGRPLDNVVAKDYDREERARARGGSNVDNMMNEAATNVFCEQEVKKNDGEVEVYRVTNQDTGEMINVDRSHEMWPEVSSAVQKGNPRKVKQLTKGQEGKKINELFGFLKGWCCWFRGGCCVWEQYMGSYGGMHSWTIQYDACCGNNGKGGCCGGAMVVPDDSNNLGGIKNEVYKRTNRNNNE